MQSPTVEQRPEEVYGSNDQYVSDARSLVCVLLTISQFLERAHLGPPEGRQVGPHIKWSRGRRYIQGGSTRVEGLQQGLQ